MLLDNIDNFNKNNMINISRYDILFDNNVEEFRIPPIITIVPSPTEDDYKIGYIQRYFIQKRSDETAYIYEVEKYYYTDILTNPFFKGVALKWKISGNREEVREMNRKSVSYASANMKTLPLYLPNHLQFHKERV
jgi:hypothetical protein